MIAALALLLTQVARVAHAQSGPPAPQVQPASIDTATTLTAREQANAEAVTRLLGIVRFFHPSDAAAAADWDSVTVATMRAALGARDDAELARRLASALAVIAPTVVVRAGADSAMPAAMNVVPEGATSITYWIHDGVLLSRQPNTYRSFRAHRAWTGAATPVLLPDPRQPHRLALGRGLVAWVPVALWSDATGTLPRVAASPAPTAAVPRWLDSVRVAHARDTLAYSPRDRAVRLADVAIAWAVLDQFYPYFDVVRVDWDAELSHAMRDAARASDACAQREALMRMIVALHDGHGNVVHACRPYAMLPVRVALVDGHAIVVATDGINEDFHDGDELLAIDGEPVARRIARLREVTPAPTSGYADYTVAQALVAGRASDDVRVERMRRDGRRDTVRTGRVVYKERIVESRPPVVKELRAGIWYVDLTRITTAQWNEAVPSLAKAAGIVLDMRGYPAALDPDALFQHLSRDTVRSAQWWIPHLVRPRAGSRSAALPFERRDSWRIPPRAPYLAAPKVFLTDGRAISYAESVMGIVEHYRMGAIVGEPTAGTNGNVNPFTLPGGYDVRWTGMRVLKHDGSVHHGVGIRPTVLAHRTRAGIAAGRDEQLERALAVLAGRDTSAAS